MFLWECLAQNNLFFASPFLFTSAVLDFCREAPLHYVYVVKYVHPVSQQELTLPAGSPGSSNSYWESTDAFSWAKSWNSSKFAWICLTPTSCQNVHPACRPPPKVIPLEGQHFAVLKTTRSTKVQLRAWTQLLQDQETAWFLLRLQIWLLQSPRDQT